MAYTDKVRTGTLAQKRGVSTFTARLKEGTKDNNILSETGNYLLAHLPPNAIITDAWIHVITESDAATSSAATLGTTDGGSEIMTGGDLDAATGKTGTLAAQIHTDTGVDLYLNITVTGAATDVGDYVVHVEYVEYEKRSGEYTLT